MMQATSKQNEMKVGVLGTGYIGKAYIHACQQQYKHKLKPVLHAVATSQEETAKAAAHEYGFANYSADWRDVCTDPEIDIVCIASPLKAHYEQAMLALEHGKHLALEKPIVIELAELNSLRERIQQTNFKVNVGYNYLHNPVIYHAKSLLEAGEIGTITNFRMYHCEDFLASQDAYCKPWHIHLSEGASVMRDIGSHALSFVNYLLGDVKELIALQKQQYPTRNGETVTCRDDHVDALLKLDNNVQGSLTASWICSGRSMHSGFEIYGSKGAICFNQERLNEIVVYAHAGENPAAKGGRVIRANNAHPEFNEVCPGDEHGIGFMDLKSLEFKNLLDAIADDSQPICNFDFGARVEQQIHACIESAATNQWQPLNY